MERSDLLRLKDALIEFGIPFRVVDVGPDEVSLEIAWSVIGVVAFRVKFKDGEYQRPDLLKLARGKDPPKIVEFKELEPAGPKLIWTKGNNDVSESNRDAGKRTEP